MNSECEAEYQEASVSEKAQAGPPRVPADMLRNSDFLLFGVWGCGQ